MLKTGLHVASLKLAGPMNWDDLEEVGLRRRSERRTRRRRPLRRLRRMRRFGNQDRAWNAGAAIAPFGRQADRGDKQIKSALYTTTQERKRDADWISNRQLEFRT